jgi:hypothetical protein
LADRDPLLPAVGRQVTPECTFDVSIDGGPLAPAGGTGVLGPATVVLNGAHQIEIHVTPTSANYWPLIGRFTIQPNGTLVPANADVPAEFEPARAINLGSDTVSVLAAHLSRLRDATPTALQSLSNVPAVRTGMIPATWPPTAWDTPLLDDVNYIDTPPIQGGNIAIVPKSLDPATVDVVLELANVNAPQTIAVSWPNAIPRNGTAGPTPFLVYFHATVAQNVRQGFYEVPGMGPYPFNFDYVYFGLWRYMNYTGDPAGTTNPRSPDPLTVDPYAKGLPYQMMASGKNAVIVLPCNRFGPEAGVMMDAPAMDGVLREIQSFMFRRAGTYTTPGLGRVALGAFSAGNLLTLTFLNKPQNQSHSFYLDTLRELYMFGSFKNGAGRNPVDWVNAALNWANAGTSAGKMVRAYLESPISNYNALVSPLPSALPFVATSGSFTAAVMNSGAWNAAATAAGNSLIASGSPGHPKFQDTHQLISAMMLVDALSRSGFT